MHLGRVTGEIFSTINHPAYDGRKLLSVDRLDGDRNPTGDYLIAVDVAGAGVGQTVLVLDEGNSARQILNYPNAPIRSVIVGIIDAVEKEEEGAEGWPKTRGDDR